MADDWDTDPDYENSGVSDESLATALTWSRVSTDASPGPRYGHAMAACGGLVYLFGGEHGVTLHNDLWSFDPATSTWTEVTQGGAIPDGRRGHTLSAYADKLYLFGGDNINGFHADFACFDPASGEWEDVDQGVFGPTPRSCHSAVVMSSEEYGDFLVVFGGAEDTDYYDDVWLWDFAGGSWDNPAVEGDIPPVRRRHSAAAWGSTMIVFAGFQKRRNLRAEHWDDLFAFDLDSYTWTKQVPNGPVPAARSGHVAAISPKGTMVVFGGFGAGSAKFNNLHLLDAKSDDLCWSSFPARNIGAPSERVLLACATVGKKIYFYGGKAAEGDEVYDTTHCLEIFI